MKIDWGALWNSLKKASPHILTGVGIVGMGAAGVMAVAATPKAIDLVELEAFNLGVSKDELTFADKFKAAWKCYIWAALTAAGGATCIIASDIHMVKKCNNLSALLASTEGSLIALKDKAVDILGQEKADEIQKEAAKESIKQREETGHAPRVPDGYFLCIDGITGQEFVSNENDIIGHINRLNLLLNSEEEISVDDYTQEFGLRDVADGFNRIWTLDGNRGKGLLDVRLTTDWANDLKTPAIFIQHRALPHERPRAR